MIKNSTNRIRYWRTGHRTQRSERTLRGEARLDITLPIRLMMKLGWHRCAIQRGELGGLRRVTRARQRHDARAHQSTGYEDESRLEDHGRNPPNNRSAISCAVRTQL